MGKGSLKAHGKGLQARGQLVMRANDLDRESASCCLGTRSLGHGVSVEGYLGPW